MAIKAMSREDAAHIVHMLQNSERFSDYRIAFSFDASHKSFKSRKLIIETQTTSPWDDEDEPMLMQVDAQAWSVAMSGNFSLIEADRPNSLPSTCPVLGEWYDYNHALNIPVGMWLIDRGNGPEKARFGYSEDLDEYIWDGATPARILIDRYF